MNSRHLRTSTTHQPWQARTWLLLLAATVAIGATSLVIGIKATGRHAKPAPHTTASTPRSPQTRAAGAQAAAVTRRKPSSLGFQAGDCLGYEFTQNRTIELDLRDLAANASSRPVTSGRLRVEQRGELLVKIYEERAGDEGGWIVGFELRRPFIKVSAPDGQQASASKDFTKAMAGEILASIERNGRIGKFIAPPAMSADALNQWKDILARWQIVLPDDESACRWTRREEDTTGVYLATYVRQAGSPPQITKTKTSYIEVRTINQTTLNGTSTITGNTVITLNPYPIRIAGQESVQLASRGLGPNIHSEAEFTFQLRQSGFDGDIAKTGPSKTAQLAAAPASLPWSAQTSPAADSPSSTPGAGATQARVAIAGLAELLARGGAESPEEQKLMESLYDAVKADDGAVEAMMDQLAQPECTKEMASVLIGVLGAAGTDMAQHSLLSMVADGNWPQQQREMSIFSFAQVQQPIPGVDAALQALHAEQGAYANNALLVLAAMGNRVQSSDPQRFDQISQYALNAASQSGLDHDAQVRNLAVVANLGPGNVPAFVEQAFTSNDATLRRASVESLERIKSDLANEMIVRALRDDDENVRVVAAKLLSDQTRPNAANLLSQTLADDNSETVRTTALLSLNQLAETDPRATSQIARAGQQDSSAEVRDFAASLLAARTSGSQRQ